MKKHVSTKSRDVSVSWHALYQAALFEANRELVPQRIADAEEAIMTRVKELFRVKADHIEEDLVLDDALYALRALRNRVVTETKAA